jgi:DNA mismatch endonuclease (patch repair protein)
VALDNLSKGVRSKVMASIRGKDTSPELAVRRLLWARGKRYRVQDRRVSGTPDITSNRHKVAVFIDGCFWHGCKQCYKEPTSNVSFWREKLKRNRERRREVKKELRSNGWRVLEFWEHDVLRDPLAVVAKIARWF